MQRNATRDLIVGLFVLLGIAAIVYLSVRVAGFSWDNKMNLKLTAKFDEISGLTVRAPVTIAGVRVGEVSDIELDKSANYRATVTLRVRNDLDLDNETLASVYTSGMLGDKYIQLQPGGGEKTLKSGDSITHTESTFVLEKVLGQVVYGITKHDENPSGPGTISTKPTSQP